MAEQLVGTVTHYFGKPRVAGITLSGELKLGDAIRIVGHTSNFTQVVESLQIDHADVEAAKAGDEIGIVVVERAREHDKVYRVNG